MSFCYPYPRPALTVDAVVFSLAEKQTKLLLIQRKNPPFEGYWAFPGGFVDIDETVETAVIRELKEETNLDGVSLEQFKVYSAIDRDPRGRTVSVVFVAKLQTQGLAVMANDDAAAAKWFALSELPKLAFDHEKILKEAIASCL